MTPELAERVVDGLKAAGVDFFTFLPESRINDILDLVLQDDHFTVVRATHEGDGVNMACGAALVGKVAAVCMEGNGLPLSVYHLQTAAIRVGVPILLLVSYIGSPGDKANSMTFTGVGMKLVPMLQAMNIPFRIVEDGDRIEERIADMVRMAQSAKQPTCLLFTGDFTVFTGGWK
jgi:sulfopyruvate decarboxylase subunit alpha